jgi:hypothetical protein
LLLKFYTMKNLFITFTIVLFFLSSCTKSAKDQIVGTWIISSSTNNGLNYTGNLGYKFTFNECTSTCNATQTVGTKTFSLTYTISTDEKTLVLTDNTTNLTFQINELSSTKLIITQTSGTQTVVATLSRI